MLNHIGVLSLMDVSIQEQDLAQFLPQKVSNLESIRTTLRRTQSRIRIGKGVEFHGQYRRLLMSALGYIKTKLHSNRNCG